MMRVLFICRGNVARSQEAAAIYNAMTASHAAVSAGIEAIMGKPINPLVMQVMVEAGYSLDGAFRKQLQPKDLQDADIVVSFVPLDQLPPITGRPVEYWDVPDPRGQSLEFHRETRDAIINLTTSFARRHGK